MPGTLTCTRCRFWESNHAVQTKGVCHRFPPQTIQGRQTPPENAWPGWRPHPEHYFPITLHDQWCGEFQEAE